MSLFWVLSKALQTASSYVSRGGSLRDLASVPGVVPGAPGRMASWIAVVEPGGAWERDRSFLSAGVWHTEGSLMAEPRPAGFPDGPVNHSPGFVRISCCFRQLLHTQITYKRSVNKGGIMNWMCWTQARLDRGSPARVSV